MVSISPKLQQPVKPEVSPAERTASLMQEIQAVSSYQATEERLQELCVQAISLKKRPVALLTALSKKFGRPVSEISQLLRTPIRREEFDPLVPKSGWIHDYIEWTRSTEPPTVFHFFIAAAVFGNALARRVYFDKGAYQVYPNVCAMILAPSGRCRKTSAANLGASLVLGSGGIVVADKTTPEALIDALQGGANALIYAQELAVFLGKQKYQEGMVPLLTTLFDCPKEWTSKTIGRGPVTLIDVSLSAILCSTVDWLQSGIAVDAFGGGFMSRFLFVVQEHTSRSFPLPPPLNKDTKNRLITELAGLLKVKGAFELMPSAQKWYEDWYQHRSIPSSSDKVFAGYFERKPDHLLRLAMIMRTSMEDRGGDFKLRKEDLIHADKILSWLEDWMPSAFDQITSSNVGEDQTRIIKQLKQAGGRLEHSNLLRKNSSRLGADQFHRAMQTLNEAKLVEFDTKSRVYVLTPEGWGD